MKYGSVCSGVEAATVAWHSLGWKPQWYSEIEHFPSQVLQHHYPETPNLGDMTKYKEWSDEQSIELLVGGTPCQSFSVAGLRKGLADPRGNLMLTYLAIAAKYRAKWLVWENVPGVLSSNRGRDFGTFLRALGELGYGYAYRVLDAQYFGVAQRRRRVFVVGCLGNWRSASAVLFERESLSRHSAPSREKGEKIAPTVTQGAPFSRTGNERVETQALITARMRGFGDYDCDGTASTVKARDYKDATDLIANHQTSYTIRDDVTPKTAKEITGTLSARDYKGVQAVVFGAQNSAKQGLSDSTEVSPTLDVSKTPAIALQANTIERSDNAGANGAGFAKNVSYTLTSGDRHAVQHAMQVRRLTPKECERLQGFPDNYTQIPYRNKSAKQCPDGPRYKALGNSMAVPVMRWIGQRIQHVENLQRPDTNKEDK